MFDQFKKDVKHYDGNHKYKEGWDDGYTECKSEGKETLHAIEKAVCP